jgi:prepilin peptidase CpaA
VSIFDYLVAGGVVVLVLGSVYSDLRWRKIPNCLTLPAIVLGLVLNFLDNSWTGLFFSFLGFSVGLGLFFLPFALGGMGAGDVKFLSAIGAFLGAKAVFNVFLYACLAGGIIALYYIITQKKIIQTIKNLLLFFKYILFFRSPEIGAELFKNPVGHIPYGLAVGMGAIGYLIWGRII